MNSTKTPLILLVFLLPLSVSAGDLDGKGLICERANADIVYGFRFVEGTVITDWLTDIELIKRGYADWEPVEGDYFIRRDFKRDEDTSYVVDRTEIRWGKNILNRQTLELIESKSGSKPWQCEVFSNDDDYWKQLENIRTQKQKKADEEKSKNKKKIVM